MYILTTVYDGVVESNKTQSFTKGVEQALLAAESINGKGQLSNLRKRLASTDFNRPMITIEESDDDVFMTLYQLQDREIMNIYSDNKEDPFHIQVVRID